MPLTIISFCLTVIAPAGVLRIYKACIYKPVFLHFVHRHMKRNLALYMHLSQKETENTKLYFLSLSEQRIYATVRCGSIKQAQRVKKKKKNIFRRFTSLFFTLSFHNVRFTQHYRERYISKGIYLHMFTILSVDVNVIIIMLLHRTYTLFCTLLQCIDLVRNGAISFIRCTRYMPIGLESDGKFKNIFRDFANSNRHVRQTDVPVT